MTAQITPAAMPNGVIGSVKQDGRTRMYFWKGDPS